MLTPNLTVRGFSTEVLPLEADVPVTEVTRDADVELANARFTVPPCRIRRLTNLRIDGFANWMGELKSVNSCIRKSAIAFGAAEITQSAGK